MRTVHSTRRFCSDAFFFNSDAINRFRFDAPIEAASALPTSTLAAEALALASRDASQSSTLSGERVHDVAPSSCAKYRPSPSPTNVGMDEI